MFKDLFFENSNVIAIFHLPNASLRLLNIVIENKTGQINLPCFVNIKTFFHYSTLVQVVVLPNNPADPKDPRTSRELPSIFIVQ